MSKNIVQLRYFGENNENNFPATVSKDDFSTENGGRIFNDYLPIAQLGVQTLPGMKFYLNDSTYPIIIGNSGVYDLMATGTLKITKLEFDPTGLQRVNDGKNNYLIVDILYGEEE